jgi:hypothetical protein
MNAHDYQSKITHRLQITVPIIIEMEVADARTTAGALSKALKLLVERLEPTTDVTSRYSWDDVFIDGEVLFGDIKHKTMCLKPVPEEPIPEPTVQDAYEPPMEPAPTAEDDIPF